MAAGKKEEPSPSHELCALGQSTAKDRSSERTPEEVAAVWAVCPGVPHPHVFVGSQHEFVSAKTRDTYLVSSFIHATGSFPFNPEKGKEKLNTFIFLKFQEKKKKSKTFWPWRRAYPSPSNI